MSLKSFGASGLVVVLFSGARAALDARTLLDPQASAVHTRWALLSNPMKIPVIRFFKRVTKDLPFFLRTYFYIKGIFLYPPAC